MWWTPWPSLFSTNPCGEVALGAAEPCVLGIKPRKVDFPLFDFDIVSVQPMPCLLMGDGYRLGSRA